MISFKNMAKRYFMTCNELCLNVRELELDHWLGQKAQDLLFLRLQTLVFNRSQHGIAFQLCAILACLRTKGLSIMVKQGIGQADHHLAAAKSALAMKLCQHTHTLYTIVGLKDKKICSNE